ncbi:hypothetical protein NQ314_001716 [Rhamnusium bicolor]|uniref:Protein SERAC1 n=1 Tax=Rhamnusium bicolor TaxID=1586634 RepID=A0AAV8ZRY1_9CUCU|nr:hypothetical protein NQ314_001716 [Rhamnusium bicolor]
MRHKKFSNLLKYLSVTFIGTSAGWAYYQIKKTQCVLETAVDTSVLKVKGTTLQQEESHVEEFVQMQPFYPYEKSNLFRNTLDSLKFAYARRLVRLANSDNKSFRIKAVRQLGKVQHLDKWHCALLANMIDPRTAVGLARSGDVDKRLFMEPPLRYHNYNRDMIDNSHIVDHDSSSLELSKFILSESDVLPKCLESLLHHSSLEKYTKDIVDLNGLPLLMEIHHRYKNDINITIKLCQILSFMSFNRSLLQPIHKSGWIGVLSEWVNHKDIRISVPAARALANLDVDNDLTYSRRLYPLHPLLRTSRDQEVDVIFVHGLLGGVFYTWRQRSQAPNVMSIIGKNKKKEIILSGIEDTNPPERKTTKEFFRELKDQIDFEDICREFEIVWDDIPLKTNINAEGPYTCPGTTYDSKKNDGSLYTHCWPKDWLAVDCHNLRIIGINYETSLSMWAPICPSEKVKFTLEERSDELLGKLLGTGLGNKPIVWVTHSMGGLIVKNILCKG